MSLVNPLRPLPIPNPLTEPYWQAALEGVLKMPHCLSCGQFHFYPRSLCPFCRSDALDWQAVSGLGEVYSYTVVHRAPSLGFKGMLPYTVGIISLDEGPHLMSRIVGVPPEEICIGMRVNVDFESQNSEINLPIFVRSLQAPRVVTRKENA
jgi:hypothetical protein